MPVSKLGEAASFASKPVGGFSHSENKGTLGVRPVVQLGPEEELFWTTSELIGGVFSRGDSRQTPPLQSFSSEQEASNSPPLIHSRVVPFSPLGFLVQPEEDDCPSSSRSVSPTDAKLQALLNSTDVFAATQVSPQCDEQEPLSIVGCKRRREGEPLEAQMSLDGMLREIASVFMASNGQIVQSVLAADVVPPNLEPPTVDQALPMIATPTAAPRCVAKKRKKSQQEPIMYDMSVLAFNRRHPPGSLRLDYSNMSGSERNRTELLLIQEEELRDLLPEEKEFLSKCEAAYSKRQGYLHRT